MTSIDTTSTMIQTRDRDHAVDPAQLAAAAFLAHIDGRVASNPAQYVRGLGRRPLGLVVDGHDSFLPPAQLSEGSEHTVRRPIRPHKNVS
jgi:hypothetical protein